MPAWLDCVLGYSDIVICNWTILNVCDLELYRSHWALSLRISFLYFFNCHHYILFSFCRNCFSCKYYICWANMIFFLHVGIPDKPSSSNVSVLDPCTIRYLWSSSFTLKGVSLCYIVNISTSTGQNVTSFPEGTTQTDFAPNDLNGLFTLCVAAMNDVGVSSATCSEFTFAAGLPLLTDIMMFSPSKSGLHMGMSS